MKLNLARRWNQIKLRVDNINDNKVTLINYFSPLSSADNERLTHIDGSQNYIFKNKLYKNSQWLIKFWENL